MITRSRFRRRRSKPQWLTTQYNESFPTTLGASPVVTIIPILTPNTQQSQFNAAGLQMLDRLASWTILRIVGRIHFHMSLTASAGRANDIMQIHHGIFVEEYDEVTGFPTSAVTNQWRPQSPANVDSKWMWHDTEAIDMPAAIAFEEGNYLACGPRYGLIDIPTRRRMPSNCRLYWAGSASFTGGVAPASWQTTISLDLRVLARWTPFRQNQAAAR